MSELDWLEIFADNLRYLMGDAGITQKELANATGLSESTISNYLNERQMPTIKSVVNICYALQCDPEELIDFDSLID